MKHCSKKMCVQTLRMLAQCALCAWANSTATPTAYPTTGTRTPRPSAVPTTSSEHPWPNPSSLPSILPTFLPTSTPTISFLPTPSPSSIPSPLASSSAPSEAPSQLPTSQPTVTPMPSSLPTLGPTRDKPLKQTPIECNGWSHQRSDDFTRETTFGKIGQICVGRRGNLQFGIEGRPYVCWNRYMFKSYVSSSFVKVGFILLPFYIFLTWLFPKLQEAAEDTVENEDNGDDFTSSLQAPLWWLQCKTFIYYAQALLLIIGFITYLVLIAQTEECTRGGNWVIVGSAIVAKSVAFPFVQCTFFYFDEVGFSGDLSGGLSNIVNALKTDSQRFVEKYGLLALICLVFQTIIVVLSLTLGIYLIPLLVPYLYLFTFYFFILAVWGYLNLKFMQKCLGYRALDAALANMPELVSPDWVLNRSDNDCICEICLMISVIVIAMVRNVVIGFKFIYYTLFVAGFANPSTFKSFVLPVFFLIPLFAIYLGPLYSGNGYSVILSDFFSAFIDLAAVDISFSFAVPTELPVFGQVCFAVSVTISIINILVAAVARCVSAQRSRPPDTPSPNSP